MAKRMPTSLFVKELAAALNRGDGYIMGSYGQNPRTGYLDLAKTDVRSSWKENGWYYTQYSGSQRTQALKWRKKCTRVWDCAGMAEGIYEIFSGTCVNTKARYIYANWCSVKGSGMIPAKRRVPGAAVFWGSSASSIHHVGYLWKPVKEGHPEGDWYIIEARGVMYGVVKAKLLSRKPNYWGYMDKYYDYSENATVEEPAPMTLGSRTLKNGSEGADVKGMQSGLIRLGYDLGSWGADGDFGDCTEQAVRQFQKDCNLTVNGVFDKSCAAALDAALIALDAPAENPQKVEIVGGDCYIRSDSSTSGKILGVAKRGTTYTYAGETAQNSWIRIRHGDGTAWVSGKYARLVK